MRSQLSIRHKANESASRVSRMSSGIPGYAVRDRRFTPGVVGSAVISATIIPFKKSEQDSRDDGMDPGAIQSNA